MEHTRTALQQEARRTRRRVVIFVVVALAGGLRVLFGDHLWAWMQGLHRYRGEYVWQGDTPSRLGEVDLRQVHESLFDDWVVGLGQGDISEERAWRGLSAAVDSEPALLAALEAMRAAQRDGDPQAWVDGAGAWTDELTARGLPWRVEGAVRLGATNDYYVRTYEVLDEGPVRLGGRDIDVRFLRRADGLNVVEGRLGHTPDDEDAGYVLVDRVVDFVVFELWPMLDVRGDPPSSVAHRAGVLATLRRDIPPSDWLILMETAPLRASALRVARSVSRRSACSGLSLSAVPWHGLDGDTLDGLTRRAVRGLGAVCPEITQQEARALRAGSEGLARTSDLDRALAALVGHVARGVALHEARHVFDEGLGLDEVEAERTAYLTSFSHPDLGPVSFMQACAGAVGLPAEALARTGLDCDAPPADLPARAAAALGEPDPPTLPDDLAVWLPLRDDR